MAKNKKVETKYKNNQTLVEVNMPSNIQIELVQGNELRHYEIFFLLATLALSTATSLWTSYCVSPNSTILFSAIVFSGLTLISGIVALYYRRKVYCGKIKKSKALNTFNG